MSKKQNIYDTWLTNTNVGYHKYAWPLLFYHVPLSHSRVILLIWYTWLTMYWHWQLFKNCYIPVLACFMLAHSTHSVVLILMRLVSIRVFWADEGLALVMESAGLWCPWIYFTSVISRRLYDWRKLITSTISRFSSMIPNLTRQSYRDFESVHRISKTAGLSIFPSVAFITAPMSNPCAIP